MKEETTVYVPISAKSKKLDIPVSIIGYAKKLYYKDGNGFMRVLIKLHPTVIMMK